MWFSPPAPPDYFFICQDCKYSRRYSGSEIFSAIWNFRSCKACRSEKLPYALPVGNTSRQNDVIVTEHAPMASLRRPRTPALSNAAMQAAAPQPPIMRGLFDATIAETMEGRATGTVSPTFPS